MIDFGPLRFVEPPDGSLVEIVHLADDEAVPDVTDAEILAGASQEAVTVLRDSLAEVARIDARLPHDGTGAGPGDGELWQRRNHYVGWLLAAAPHAGFRAGLGHDPAGAEGYKDVVLMDLPTGQVSWHVPTGYFAGRPIPAYAGAWDGHTRSDQARRIATYLAT